MRNRTNRVRRGVRLVPVLLVVLLLPGLAVSRTAPVSEAVTEAGIVRLTASLLARSQLAHRELDGELAGDFLDRYLEALDPERALFLQSDLAQFAPYRATLAFDTLRRGSTTLAHAVFDRFLDRLRDRADFVATTLREERFEFDGDDVFTPDRDGAAAPADLAAARSLWHKRLRADYLQQKLDGRAHPAIVESLSERAARRVRDMEQMSRSQVLEVYLSALARVYDPHSDYLGHEQMEDFQISMNLSLVGIGARLRSVEGRCEVVDLVPGGPAMRSGQLGPGDRIIAVGQAEEPPVDVENMPLRRIVAMIRGEKGTVVNLTVIAADDDGRARRNVRLVRDEIRLEEQRASATVVDFPAPAGPARRLAVLHLPSFYANLGAKRGEPAGAGANVTDDVRILLGKLASEDVQGIVLDLRGNSGGSLTEAINLTGLFIESGPVVQTRGTGGAVSVALDPDPALVFGGPLVVLTSRLSASASEIVAGALQDYGRAVIVGDPSTFGKGTVQSVVPLAPLMQRAGLAYGYDPGALKVTIRKFYRPAGGSTQLKGVVPDILVSSISGVRPVGESRLDNPLPWDVVPPATFERLGNVTPYLAQLRERSTRRTSEREDFAFLRREIDRIEKRQAEKTVSLNEPTLRAEIADRERRREAFREALTALEEPRPETRLITVKDGAGVTETAATTAPGTDGADDGEPQRDLVLDEAQRILSDYLDLFEANRRPAGHRLSGNPASAAR